MKIWHTRYTDFLWSYLVNHIATLTGSYSANLISVNFNLTHLDSKVANAQKNGAIGILIYNDPINYAPGPQIYPNGMWLPGDGVQRGSVNGAGGGDTLSPGWPSTSEYFQLNSTFNITF